MNPMFSCRDQFQSHYVDSRKLVAVVQRQNKDLLQKVQLTHNRVRST